MDAIGVMSVRSFISVMRVMRIMDVVTVSSEMLNGTNVNDC